MSQLSFEPCHASLWFEHCHDTNLPRVTSQPRPATIKKKHSKATTRNQQRGHCTFFLALTTKGHLIHWSDWRTVLRHTLHDTCLTWLHTCAIVECKRVMSACCKNRHVFDTWHPRVLFLEKMTVFAGALVSLCAVSKCEQSNRLDHWSLSWHPHPSLQSLLVARSYSS